MNERIKKKKEILERNEIIHKDKYKDLLELLKNKEELEKKKKEAKEKLEKLEQKRVRGGKNKELEEVRSKRKVKLVTQDPAIREEMKKLLSKRLTKVKTPTAPPSTPKTPGESSPISKGSDSPKTTAPTMTMTADTEGQQEEGKEVLLSRTSFKDFDVNGRRENLKKVMKNLNLGEDYVGHAINQYYNKYERENPEKPTQRRSYEGIDKLRSNDILEVYKTILDDPDLQEEINRKFIIKDRLPVGRTAKGVTELGATKKKKGKK
jgi:hypothetical protein